MAAALLFLRLAYARVAEHLPLQPSGRSEPPPTTDESLSPAGAELSRPSEVG